MDPIRPTQNDPNQHDQDIDLTSNPPLVRAAGEVGAVAHRGGRPPQNVYQALQRQGGDRHLGAQVQNAPQRVQNLYQMALANDNPLVLAPPVRQRAMRPGRPQAAAFNYPAALTPAVQSGPLQMVLEEEPLAPSAPEPVQANNQQVGSQSPLMLAVRQTLKDNLTQGVNLLAAHMLKTPLANHLDAVEPLSRSNAQSNGEFVRPSVQEVRRLLKLIRNTPNISSRLKAGLEVQVRKICNLHDQLQPVIAKAFNPYLARGGQALLVNPNSDGQKPWIGTFINMISDATGIPSIPTQNLSATQKKQIFQEWIKIASLVEDSNKKDYGQLRDQIVESELSRLGSGPTGLSVLLDQKAAVCRELSIIASAVFAEFGIASRVGSGTVYQNSSPGAHVWLEAVGEQGQLEAIIDTNCAKDVFDTFEAYSDKLDGVTYRSDGGGQQTLVEYQIQRLYDEARW